jgi:hypothetical protein
MTKKEIGCGVEAHDEECLCDVRVSSQEVPIRVKNLVIDFTFGEDICRLRGYTQTWERDQIINYLEDILKVHDTINEGYFRHRNGSLIARNAVGLSRGLLSEYQRNELRRIILLGASYKDVMQHALDNWGVEVSKSYAAHLRKRTLPKKKGQNT